MEEKIQEMEEEIKALKRENRLLKICFCKCRDCKHADLYIPSYMYPFYNPKCKIHHKDVKPDDDACEDFELCGRTSR